MTLDFRKHEDVVFERAPLTSVLCQIRFPQILAILDRAGISGVQEALRNEYPDFDSGVEAQFAFNQDGAELKMKPPVWRFRTLDEMWRVSLGVDFLALETPDYHHFKDFADRLFFVISAAERTLSPGPSLRIGLRKVNLIEHPDVAQPSDWNGLLTSQLLGLAGDSSLPGTARRDYSEYMIADDAGDALAIRHGIDPDSSANYRLDLDYWTERRFDVTPTTQLRDLLAAFSDSMTAFFHSCLEQRMYDHLQPKPRTEVENA